MHSIRTKLTILNVIATSAAILIGTIIAGVSIASFGHDLSANNIGLLAETGKNNLNSYFKSVEQSVNTVSALIIDNLDGVDDSNFATSLSAHVDYAQKVFHQAAVNTNGVFTYYYRFALPITEATQEKGFWYVRNSQGEYESHTVTDLSNEENECVWFYTPRDTGQSLWLSPYITDGLNEYVVSYNTPIYRNNRSDFIGVIGIEIDYKALGEQIKDIKALNNGYAFIVENKNGTIVYHPTIDLFAMPASEWPQCPVEILENIKNGTKHVEYNYQGIHKHGSVLSLSNGMSIVVAVPESDISAMWQTTVLWMVIAGITLIALVITATALFSRRITKPLKELTVAAKEINEGNYDIKLDYKGDDEMGVLTNAVNQLVANLGEYVHDLNKLAYADALTAVRNRSAFQVALEELQKRIDAGEQGLSFAVAIFDCDNLKDINDVHGHDKGNVYLRNSCHLITAVFENSAVYRIGGDEFAVILLNQDYENKKTLEAEFKKKSADICKFAKEPWEQVRVSLGIADYDPSIDKTVEEVMVHADHLMYENKRKRKAQKQS